MDDVHHHFEVQDVQDGTEITPPTVIHENLIRTIVGDLVELAPEIVSFIRGDHVMSEDLDVQDVQDGIEIAPPNGKVSPQRQEAIKALVKDLFKLRHQESRKDPKTVREHEALVRSHTKRSS
jgi:hypothetical protein